LSSPGLLPTPTRATGRNARHGDTSRGDDLPEAVRYLPTPNATDWKGSGATQGRERDGRPRPPGDVDLPEAVALLKTPTAQLAVNGGSQHPDKRKAGGHGPTLADQVEHELLPTPAARDWKSGQSNLIGTNARPLNEVVEMSLLPGGGNLLPTPRATDGTNGGPNQRGSSGDLMLPSAVTHLLPTPSVADGTGGHKSRSGDRSGELLLPGIVRELSAATRPQCDGTSGSSGG
jgi:hypothetical protein